jgi:hypothetical protein
VASVSAYCSVKVSGKGASMSTRSRNRSRPGISRPLTSSKIAYPFWAKKQRMASMCWAMSATGITSSEPGTFTHQVLCPSMWGSSAGRWSRWSDSRRSRPAWRSTMS